MARGWIKHNGGPRGNGDCNNIDQEGRNPHASRTINVPCICSPYPPRLRWILVLGKGERRPVIVLDTHLSRRLFEAEPESSLVHAAPSRFDSFKVSLELGLGRIKSLDGIWKEAGGLVHRCTNLTPYRAQRFPNSPSLKSEISRGGRSTCNDGEQRY